MNTRKRREANKAAVAEGLQDTADQRAALAAEHALYDAMLAEYAPVLSCYDDDPLGDDLGDDLLYPEDDGMLFSDDDFFPEGTCYDDDHYPYG